MGVKQLGLTSYKLTTAKKTTRRETFLAGMEVVVPGECNPHSPPVSLHGHGGFSRLRRSA
jgi:hypothetical protein